MCQNYLIGFCPLGPECPKVHVKSMVSPKDLCLSTIANMPAEFNWPLGHSTVTVASNRGQKIVCHKCGVEGHKSTYCQEDKLSEDQLQMLFKNPGVFST